MKKIKIILKKITDAGNSRFLLPVLIAGIVLGLILGGGNGKTSGSDTGSQAEPHLSESSESGIWTCSMHPQIRLPEKGKCPLCGMDLIPAGSEDDDLGERELKLSPNAIKLAEIRTSPVERRSVHSEIRMSGKVQFDETGLRFITSRIPGRIDRLFVNFTGAEVGKGDPLAMIYSPDLISAQQELIQSVRSHNRGYAGAVRNKLRLWGLTAKQIETIEKSGIIQEHMTVFSPFGGVVVHKNVSEGLYVEPGSKIYTIADLSSVWIILDAYESDLPWIRSGQEVTFESDSFPGEVFKGRISFVDPVMDPGSRTVKIRVKLKNPGFKLKPDMYVKAVLRSELSDGEKAVKTGSPGNGGDELAPVVIPQTAPLITGTRAVVYVAVKGREGVFEGREVVLGPKAGAYYLVREGLREGEQIVTNGAFKIDSDLQIRAKPSMMSPDGGVPVSGHDHGQARSPQKSEAPQTGIPESRVPAQFRKSVTDALSSYFTIGDKLSRDSLPDSITEAKKLLKRLQAVDMNLIEGDSHMQWMKLEGRIREAAEKIAASASIGSARTAFEMLTGPVYQALTLYGSDQKPYYRFHCPMAFDNKGAFWLQKNTDTRNPYFGESMLTCKDSMEKIPVSDEK